MKTQLIRIPSHIPDSVILEAIEAHQPRSIKLKLHYDLPTGGDGLYTNLKKPVKVTALQVVDTGGTPELQVHFDKKSWKVSDDDVIYTDKKFLSGLNALLKKHGITVPVDYTEHGMQTDSYVSLEPKYGKGEQKFVDEFAAAAKAQPFKLEEEAPVTEARSVDRMYINKRIKDFNRGIVSFSDLIAGIAIDLEIRNFPKAIKELETHLAASSNTEGKRPVIDTNADEIFALNLHTIKEAKEDGKLDPTESNLLLQKLDGFAGLTKADYTKMLTFVKKAGQRKMQIPSNLHGNIATFLNFIFDDLAADRVALTRTISSKIPEPAPTIVRADVAK